MSGLRIRWVGGFSGEFCYWVVVFLQQGDCLKIGGKWLVALIQQGICSGGDAIAKPTGAKGGRVGTANLCSL